MSTRISIHPTRIVHALLVAVLCTTLAGSAFADRNGRSRDGGSRGRDARQQVGNGSGRDRQSGPRGSATYQPRGDRSGRAGTDRPTDSARRTDRTPAVDRPANGGRTDRPVRIDRPGDGGQTDRPVRIDRPTDGNQNRPAPVFDRPGDGNRDGRRPPTIYPPRDNGRNTRPERPRVYAPKPHVDVRSDYRPKGYTPPIFRGGSYYYSSRPSNRSYRYGNWVFDRYDAGSSRPSIYFHYGYFPYVRVSRVIVEPYIVVGYHSGPVAITAGYYLSKQATTGLDNALSDIRDAWQEGRLDLITTHVSGDRRIAVLLDGKYDYSIESDDYSKMTSDALDNIRTVSFTWQSTRERTDGDYTAFGKHVYNDASGATRIVYVSYTLARIGGGYYIVEVGSSTTPLY